MEKNNVHPLKKICKQVWQIEEEAVKCARKKGTRRKAPAPSTYVRPWSPARLDPDVATGKKLHSALPHSSCFLTKRWEVRDRNENKGQK